MTDRTSLALGVMEGQGAYNRHAKIPAQGAVLAIPFLEKAARDIAVDPDVQPIVIADYGSSQGKNSLAPMQIAIRNLWPRLSPNRSVFVFHIDQPSNDFNSLLEVVSSDPDRYALDEKRIFPCAVARSFYKRVLPPGSVHLGWCSYAAVWLSRVPSSIPGHFFPACSTGAVRATFARQAAEDWETFLTQRACEMRPGARLVVVLPALSDNRLSGFVELMNHANVVLREMVDEGFITAEERASMILPAYPRSKDELLTPFDRDGQFQHLIVEDLDISPFPDAAWADYQLDGDNGALARKRALFFRAVFMPSLAFALSRVRGGDGEVLFSFADRLQDGLTQRLTCSPAPADMVVETIVVSKCR